MQKILILIATALSLFAAAILLFTKGIFNGWISSFPDFDPQLYDTYQIYAAIFIYIGLACLIGCLICIGFLIRLFLISRKNKKTLKSHKLWQEQTEASEELFDVLCDVLDSDPDCYDTKNNNN